ncbi:MAG: hypothetical protein WDW38_000352 [Sanguina aurantia]
MGCETVTLYVDLMSQPSRACVIFCRLHGLPVVESIVNIGRGETKAAAFRAINPLGKVPALQEKGPDGTSQLVVESGAILEASGEHEYLALRFAHMIPSHWYPPPPAQSDSPATRTAAAVQALRGRTDVTSALHWYHSSIRAGCARIVWNKVLAPRFGVPASEAIAQEGVSLLQQSLKSMDDFWLRVRGPFVALCRHRPAVPMEQLAMLDLESHGCSMASLLQPHPAVQAWLRAVAGACGPQYAEVHSMLAKSVAAAGRGKKATASRL